VNGTHETKEPHPERTSHEMNVRGHGNVQNNPKTGKHSSKRHFQHFSLEHVEGLERNIADDHLLSVRPPTLRSVAPSNVDHRWGGSLKFRLWQEKTHLFGNKTCFFLWKVTQDFGILVEILDPLAKMIRLGASIRELEYKKKSCWWARKQ